MKAALLGLVLLAAVPLAAAEFVPTGQYIVPLPVGPYSNSTPRYVTGTWTTTNPDGWELFRAIQNNFMYATNYARTNGGGGGGMANLHVAQNGTNDGYVPYLNFVGPDWQVLYGDPVAEIHYNLTAGNILSVLSGSGSSAQVSSVVVKDSVTGFSTAIGVQSGQLQLTVTDDTVGGTQIVFTDAVTSKATIVTVQNGQLQLSVQN